MQNYPPYWLDETAEWFQDGDGQELNASGVITPLRHLVNIAATSASHTHHSHLYVTMTTLRGRVDLTPNTCKGNVVQRFERRLIYEAFKESGPF